jgi:3-hydroxyisobutyrate dehydrogenase-like beta-hydroxyacid dehydrogenase
MGETTVTMLGLGRMGSALARGFRKAGARVTVWNRDASKAEALRSEGFAVAGSLAEAIGASDTIAVSVLNYAASGSLLFGDEKARGLLRGKSIVEFTTGTPAEAREASKQAGEAGAGYLDAAIMAYPSGIGTAEATILFSGSQDVFSRHEPQLRVLGGNAMYLGDNVGAAATLDLALLDFYYGANVAILHGASICQSEGFPLEIYAKALEGFAPILTATAQLGAQMIPARSYAGTEATNDIHAAALAHIVRASRDARLDGFPAVVMRYFDKALAKGHGPDEIVALYEAMRPES